LKILHIIAGELSGGAARGAYWLHQALCDLGVDSTVLTNSRSTLGDPSVISVAQTSTQKLKHLFIQRLGTLPTKLYRKRKRIIFNTGFEGIDITRHPAYQEADIIHLHWINGLVRMRSLHKIEKPIVWTMRDMWPMTGGCHYSMECDRYTLGCGQCPQLGSRSTFDLSRLIVSNKRASLPQHLRAVGISHWLSDCASMSRVFKEFVVETISNNVSTNQFFPIKKEYAREMLGLRPGQKKIVLVGAHNVTNFYKGFASFIDAINFLDTDDLYFLIFGDIAASVMNGLGVEYTSLGFLSDVVSMRLAYSAADVFVAPSRMDAFGKTLAESMACGTPVVCFDASGPKDIVKHKITGYKAVPFEAKDLARGIQWVLERSEEDYNLLCKQSRMRVETHFDSCIIANQYQELYLRLLDRAER